MRESEGVQATEVSDRCLKASFRKAEVQKTLDTGYEYDEPDQNSVVGQRPQIRPITLISSFCGVPALPRVSNHSFFRLSVCSLVAGILAPVTTSRTDEHPRRKSREWLEGLLARVLVSTFLREVRATCCSARSRGKTRCRTGTEATRYKVGPRPVNGFTLGLPWRTRGSPAAGVRGRGAGPGACQVLCR